MPRRSRPLAALVAMLAALSVTACSAGGSEGKPEVVASFYPLQFVAQRIVGDHGAVSNLTSPGVEPHDLELSPRQADSISEAKVVFYEKGLSPAVDEAVANASPQHVVDAGHGVGLHPTGESDHGEVDPHFWQDPTLLAKSADAFTAEMKKADPANAADYTANNAKLQADLKTLDEEYRTGLAHCTTRTLVVSHDAFEYLGKRYHLTVHSIAGLSPDAEPSARHLAELADLVRIDKISTVFSERLASPKLAQTLAAEAGVHTQVLDPIEGLTSQDSGANYLTLMRANLRAIQEAGGCR